MVKLDYVDKKVKASGTEPERKNKRHREHTMSTLVDWGYNSQGPTSCSTSW